jgi:hypothetical protein
MSQPKVLTWNHKQVQIYNLLMTGMMPGKVAQQLGVAKSSVSKINSAIKKGQSPSAPYNNHPKKIKHLSPFAKVNHDDVDEESEDTDQPSENSDEQNEAPVGDASILLLKPVTQICDMTPIMINARYVAITELGWPEDVTWEDFFDTCLVHLFKYWGYGLQEAYKLEG